MRVSLSSFGRFPLAFVLSPCPADKDFSSRSSDEQALWNYRLKPMNLWLQGMISTCYSKIDETLAFGFYPLNHFRLLCCQFWGRITLETDFCFEYLEHFLTDVHVGWNLETCELNFCPDEIAFQLVFWLKNLQRCCFDSPDLGKPWCWITVLQISLRNGNSPTFSSCWAGVENLVRPLACQNLEVLDLDSVFASTLVLWIHGLWFLIQKSGITILLESRVGSLFRLFSLLGLYREGWLDLIFFERNSFDLYGYSVNDKFLPNPFCLSFPHPGILNVCLGSSHSSHVMKSYFLGLLANDNCKGLFHDFDLVFELHPSILALLHPSLTFYPRIWFVIETIWCPSFILKQRKKGDTFFCANAVIGTQISTVCFGDGPILELMKLCSTSFFAISGYLLLVPRFMNLVPYDSVVNYLNFSNGTCGLLGLLVAELDHGLVFNELIKNWGIIEFTHLWCLSHKGWNLCNSYDLSAHYHDHLFRRCAIMWCITDGLKDEVLDTISTCVLDQSLATFVFRRLFVASVSQNCRILGQNLCCVRWTFIFSSMSIWRRERKWFDVSLNCVVGTRMTSSQVIFLFCILRPITIKLVTRKIYANDLCDRRMLPMKLFGWHQAQLCLI